MDKFKNFKNQCFMCKKARENLQHIFLDCDLTKNFLDEIINNNKTFNLIESKPSYVFYHENCNYEEIKTLSAFKISVWKFRGMARNSNKQLSCSILKRIFSKEINYY